MDFSVSTDDPLTTVFNTTAVTTEATIATTAEPSASVPEVFGFIAAGVAVFFFGSNFVPVKRFETGDGELYIPYPFTITLYSVYHCSRHVFPACPLR
jgi:hypothetical protein